MKYVNTGVVFQEIPDETTLSINISNCPCHCMGCHSEYLWDDVGTPLNVMSLKTMLDEYGKDVIELEKRLSELAAPDAARREKYSKRHAAAPER